MNFNLVRGLIFFTADLITFLFPKPVYDWQIRFEERYCQWFIRKKWWLTYVELGEKHAMKINFYTAILFFVISAGLFVHGIFSKPI